MPRISVIQVHSRAFNAVTAYFLNGQVGRGMYQVDIFFGGIHENVG